jgi:hypothetical protein
MEEQGAIGEHEEAVLHCGGHKHSTLGGKSLTIRAVDLEKLEVFHHKAMCHILNITKWQQATTRLTNECLQKQLD